MFKSWSKKNKIKAVFKLQFHVTQVPKLKKPAVMISLVPEDAGKPSVKLEKVPVQDGTCTWENPVFEPVKLTMENKTGKINEKIYHFIVSAGSSKSGYLGEASIDFSDFVTETEALTVSLPLKFANSGAVLHVTIQRMLGPEDEGSFREENGDPKLMKNRSMESQENNWDIDRNNHSFAEKEELVENGAANFLAPFGAKAPMPLIGKVDSSLENNKTQKRRTLNWSADSTSDDSLLIESSSSVEEDHPREGSKEVSDDDSVEKLKNEVTILTRQAELSEMEIQSLRKHMDKEIKLGQNLSRQINGLKEERDKIKLECERLKSSSKKSNDDAEVEAPKRLQAAIKDSKAQVEAMKQELGHEKKVSGNLQLQLKKTQDSNSELTMVVKDLEDLVERKNRVISDLSSEVETEKKERRRSEEENSRGRGGDVEEIELLEAKIRDLHGEIDIYEEEKEKQSVCIKHLTSKHDLLKQDYYNMSLKLKRNQEDQLKMENECEDYIATITELESQVERLEETVKKQAREFAEALISVNELEGRGKALERELDKQAKGFKDDLEAMKRAKVELEQKAIQAEEEMKNGKLSSSIKAERLQEELRKLSLEMSHKVGENEKQAIEALTEVSELRLQNRILEDKLDKVSKEMRLMKDQERMKLQEFTDKIGLKEKQLGNISLELNDKSKQLECAKKKEEDNHEAFVTEIQMLRAEIERLGAEKSEHTKAAEDEKSRLRAETERMKKSLREKDSLIQRLNKENENLEKKRAPVKQEAKKESKLASLHANEQCNISDLQAEVASLKEKNSSMEKELKEMEERYSETSLRFAEVEGERQILVMTVRNLKSGKKS